MLPAHTGAMENWGLIIYGESRVLWDENWFDAEERLRTHAITAHELAHFVSKLHDMELRYTILILIVTKHKCAEYL